jgi:hypothetical protein
MRVTRVRWLLAVIMVGFALTACGGQGAEAIKSRLPSASVAPTVASPTGGLPSGGLPRPSRSPETTEPPTTEAPTTEAPTTEAPTTEAPTTQPPTTEAPTTEAPTTEAPTTEPPTSAPAAAGSPSPASSPGQAAAEEDSFAWGLLLLLGIALIATAWILLASRSRHAATAWRANAGRAYATGTSLRSALSAAMTAAPGAGAAAPGADPRWAGVDRLAGDLALQLPPLESGSPDERATAAVRAISTSLASLRSAAQAQRTTGDEASLSVLRVRTDDFDTALQALRALLGQAPA